MYFSYFYWNTKINWQSLLIIVEKKKKSCLPLCLHLWFLLLLFFMLLSRSHCLRPLLGRAALVFGVDPWEAQGGWTFASFKHWNRQPRALINTLCFKHCTRTRPWIQQSLPLSVCRASVGSRRLVLLGGTLQQALLSALQLASPAVNSDTTSETTC